MKNKDSLEMLFQKDDLLGRPGMGIARNALVPPSSHHNACLQSTYRSQA